MMALTRAEQAKEEKSMALRLAAAQTAIAIARLIAVRHGNLSLDDNGVFYATPKNEFRRYPQAMRDLPAEEGSGVFLRFHLDDESSPEEAHRIMADIEKYLQHPLTRAEKNTNFAMFMPLKEKVNIEAQSRAIYVEITPFIDRARHCEDIDQQVGRREMLKILLGAAGAVAVGDGLRRIGGSEPDDSGTKATGTAEVAAGLATSYPALGIMEREGANLLRSRQDGCADDSRERMERFCANIARQFRVEPDELKRYNQVSTGRQLS